jgi:hypothetical protein
MQAQELIRAAAEVIRSGGWSQGDHARDMLGRGVPLFGGTGGESARAQINPDAVAFSIYGALVKAAAVNRANVPPALWVLLVEQAAKELSEATPGPKAVPGGTNHLNALILYNEHMDRTEAEVLSFLETAALTIEAREQA